MFVFYLLCLRIYSYVYVYSLTKIILPAELSGLKSHAVTLYEAGKLGHASITDLCKDLSTLEGAKFEGELQEFANHAFSLRCVLECLQSGGVASDAKVGEDKMDLATVSNDEFVYVCVCDSVCVSLCLFVAQCVCVFTS